MCACSVQATTPPRPVPLSLTDSMDVRFRFRDQEQTTTTLEISAADSIVWIWVSFDWLIINLQLIFPLFLVYLANFNWVLFTVVLMFFHFLTSEYFWTFAQRCGQHPLENILCIWVLLLCFDQESWLHVYFSINFALVLKTLPKCPWSLRFQAWRKEWYSHVHARPYHQALFFLILFFTYSWCPYTYINTWLQTPGTSTRPSTSLVLWPCNCLYPLFYKPQTP